MIIVLHGADDYRREARRREYIEQFSKKYGALGIEIFDLEEPDAGKDLDAFLRNRSLFAPAKLGVVYHALDLTPKELKKLTQHLADSKRDHLVIVAENKVVPKPYAFLAVKPSVVEAFPVLSGAEWRSFVAKQAKKTGVNLSAPAAQALARLYAGDSWRLATELEKLRGLGKATIEERDIERMHAELTDDFWKTMQELRHYDIGRRVVALERLLAAHEPPAKLFHLLAALAKNKIARAAADDVSVKSGKLDYEEALVDLAIS